jgi:hypothetical protein
VNGHAERNEARNHLLVLALKLDVAERSIGTDEKAAAAVVKLQAELELAARDLTSAVDDSPPREWPKGWAITPDVIP